MIFHVQVTPYMDHPHHHYHLVDHTIHVVFTENYEILFRWCGFQCLHRQFIRRGVPALYWGSEKLGRYRFTKKNFYSL